MILCCDRNCVVIGLCCDRYDCVVIGLCCDRIVL